MYYPSKQADGYRMRDTPTRIYPTGPVYHDFLPVNLNTGTSIWDVFGGSESTQESTLEEEKTEYARPKGHPDGTPSLPVNDIAHCFFIRDRHYLPADMGTARLPPTDSIQCKWPQAVGTPLQDKLSAVSQVLLDKEKWINHL
jgi:hypothetical protein